MGTLLFVVGIGWKHRNIGLSEIVDVLVVMCLHQNGCCSQMFASNFKQEAVQLELMTCLKFPLAKWEVVNATTHMKGG